MRKSDALSEKVVRGPDTPFKGARIPTSLPKISPMQDNKLLFYLVNLWSRLTMSIPYLREKAPEGMQSAIPDVVQAFIDHRFKALKEGAVFEGAGSLVGALLLLRE